MTPEEVARHIQPPNLEAEGAVLGAVFCDNAALQKVAGILQPADFYRESHGKIFSAMLDLAERSEPVDVLVISDLLKAKKELEGIGGTHYLTQLADFTPTAANVVYYARIVKAAAKRRVALAAIAEAQEALYAGDGELEDVSARLVSNLAATTARTESDFEGVDVVVNKTLKDIQRASESGDGITGIPTGLMAIDQGIGGLARGSLVNIAGRPGMGKTAFADTVAVHAARRGYGVAFVTAESPSREIVQRILAAQTGIENRNLRRGKLFDTDYPKLTASSVALSKLPIALLDGHRSWDVIKAKIRALRQKRPVDLIVVDYAQLLSAPVPKGERYLEVGRISAEAKNLAVELDAAFLLLAQVNREVENRTNKRPQLSDLRESGNLEQDADIVGFLYRPYVYGEDQPKDLAELNIEKNRNGARGRILLRFAEETTWFSDWIAA
jgi:replicative DNA helicase